MLSNDDLHAIKQIVDDAFEDSDQRTAAGFVEVHEKIDKVEAKLEAKIDKVEAKLEAKIDKVEAKLEAKIDNLDNKLSVKDGKLENTVHRVDQHEIDITSIKKNLSLA